MIGVGLSLVDHTLGSEGHEGDGGRVVQEVNVQSSFLRIDVEPAFQGVSHLHLVPPSLLGSPDVFGLFNKGGSDISRSQQIAHLDLLHADFDPAALLLRDLTSRQEKGQDETDSDLSSNTHNTLNCGF